MRKSHTAPQYIFWKAEKKRFTSQTQFRTENTPATIGADQLCFALQQLGNNGNSANFPKIINKTSKLSKSLTTTMPTFDGKSEKFLLFEAIFQTRLKIPSQLTEDDRINYFHSLMRGDELQTLKRLFAQSKRTWEKSQQFSEGNT